MSEKTHNQSYSVYETTERKLEDIQKGLGLTNRSVAMRHCVEVIHRLYQDRILAEAFHKIYVNRMGALIADGATLLETTEGRRN